ncbi:VWA domain-containing protein (plasmid) [Aneurinibacillus sp. Ricciae_BoGa-3]|uniref:vWA domain-containing protein n=1 Tax=Aneurinibacillus sp. Ricciae_BoGa-3 TaxID=3022697 RepID=UPI0023417251|nr:VWA domain-containing protein [Aneurinibacillus sp. Ricciae_BoGa-3]WCK57064.1 VWA domain-containing protein [Aneurinibacillus sp. Ricciae_BoGa-3]
MGIFDFFKKKAPEKAPPPLGSTYSPPPPANVAPNYPNAPVNTRKEEAIQTLSLRKETFALSLRKKSMENVIARIAVAMDKSGSMKKLYKDGTVQSVVERLLPVAVRLDDNGELDMWLFADNAKRLQSISEQDFFDYVKREILNNPANDFWGGTDYAPVIHDIVQKYVREEPSNVPTFVIFITDGENYDKEEAKQAIIQASHHNIFFQFIGIGDEDFNFLKTLDTMGGRYIDNANFFEIQNVNLVSDDELYDLLLNEYPSWEREAKRVGLLQ